MKRLSALLLVAFCASVSHASDVAIPNEFTNGTKADALEVNANFDAVEAGIDDNDSRIDELVSDAGYQPIYYVEDYGTGLTGINAALAACDAAADAASSMPGIVMLPRGGTTITVTGANSSPLIQMPETDNGSDVTRFASCQLRGWGMTPQQAFGNPSTGSFLYFYNPDSMVAGADGRKVIIKFGAYGQEFADFGIGISGAAPTDYDDARVFFGCSTDLGSGECKNSIKGWELNRVSLGSANTSGGGVGLESIFALDGAIRDSWFLNFTTGYLPTSATGTSNNTVTVENNRFSGNDDAILIDGALACQDMYLFENTIEGNVNGVHLTDDATCHVTMIGNHFEQDSAGTQAGVRDVWVEGTAGSVTIIGGYMAGDITDANHIVFAQAQGSTVPTHVIHGVRFAEEGVANFTAAASTRLIINGDYSRDSFTPPDNSIALGTKTTGNYVATIADSGSSEVTVSGSGSESAAVTLGLAAGITRDSELSAYTAGTITPADGTTACNTGDMHLETDAFKIYFCTDGATDKWYGVALSDTP